MKERAGNMRIREGASRDGLRSRSGRAGPKDEAEMNPFKEMVKPLTWGSHGSSLSHLCAKLPVKPLPAARSLTATPFGASRRTGFWPGPAVQAALTVGPADDEYEREADRVADQVMRMPEPGAQRSCRSCHEVETVRRAPLAARITPLVERQTAPEEEEELQTKPLAGQVQRAGANGGPAGLELEQSLARARGSGSPLGEGVRGRMENAFGFDFSSVRIHSDARADSLSRSIQARAFTRGQDIFLRQGEYQSASARGQRLLAHELTHVVQQRGGVVQRDVKKYKDETNNDHMHKAAKALDSDVQKAKKIIDTDPLLNSVGYEEGSYLERWVKTFTKFTTTGEVPVFFFASYGYAVETLASQFFLSHNFNGYNVADQVSHGHTRPDFVIRRGRDEIAWLDITSWASQGHIYSKQGSGWNARPYVAEILYEMPNPKDFAVTASGKLTKDQLEALNKAQEDQALRMFTFDKGMKKMGLLLGEAYRKAYEEKGPLSMTAVKDITTETCRLHLNNYSDREITPSWAAGVLASITDIEVGEAFYSGENWAKWAFNVIDRKTGRALLYEFGKRP